MRIRIELDVRTCDGHDDFERSLKPKLEEALTCAVDACRCELAHVRILTSAPYRDIDQVPPGGIAGIAILVLREHGGRMGAAMLAMYVGKIAPQLFRRSDQTKAIEDALHYRRARGFPVDRDSDGKWYIAETGKDGEF